tara:strand:+ start:421 stop:642 length:222 start_codon:yes stop_codon:yes gene_type:complete
MKKNPNAKVLNVSAEVGSQLDNVKTWFKEQTGVRMGYGDAISYLYTHWQKTDPAKQQDDPQQMQLFGEGEGNG